METISKKQEIIQYRINDYVITQALDNFIFFTENIHRNVFNNTIVAEVTVTEFDFTLIPAVFVQLGDKTKMLIKNGDMQDYINRYIYESYKQTWLEQAFAEIKSDLS